MGGGEPYHPDWTYGDIDDSPTKTYMIEHGNDPAVKRLFDLAVAKRPAEELYDLRKDPDQFHNVAGDPFYAKVKEELGRPADGGAQGHQRPACLRQRGRLRHLSRTTAASR